jgi:hypothetical protein
MRKFAEKYSFSDPVVYLINFSFTKRSENLRKETSQKEIQIQRINGSTFKR